MDKEMAFLFSILVSINVTFINLITKSAKPLMFLDSRPISLCNTMHKMILKIIVSRIKQTMSNHISEKRLGFLDKKQIHNAMAITQKCIHFI